MITERCPSCGVVTKTHKGVSHSYLKSSAGCWGLYGELLNLEYSDYQYSSYHNLTVDCYMLQHLDGELPQTLVSVNIHLISLYCYFELGAELKELTNIKQFAAGYRANFIWLEPPSTLVNINIDNVLAATSFDQHKKVVLAWAKDIFQQWHMHHSQIATLANPVMRNLL